VFYSTEGQQAHAVRSLGEITFGGKMLEGTRGVPPPPHTKGGQCRIVAARPTPSGKMKRDETVKVGDKLKTSYRWCFCNGDDTFTSKRMNKMLKK
jgi:hypothetical protein